MYYIVVKFQTPDYNTFRDRKNVLAWWKAMHANCTGCLKNGANQMHILCTCIGRYLTSLQPDLCDTDMLTLNTPSPDPSLLGGMVNIILLHGMRSARGNGIGCFGSVLPATKAKKRCNLCKKVPAVISCKLAIA